MSKVTERTYMPGRALAAAGVTRDEAHQWRKAEWLRTALANDEPGRARRYSRENVYEMALFAALVKGEARVSHHVAAEAVEMILERNTSEPAWAAFVSSDADPEFLYMHNMPRRSGFVLLFDRVLRDADDALAAK